MANRVRITFPETALFSCTLRVRASDLNYAGHLGHDRLVGLLHEARVRFLHSLDVEEIDEGGRVLVVADLMVSYRSEAFSGEDLHIEIAPEELRPRSFELLYRVRAGDRLVALARTGLVAFDSKAKRPTFLPDPLRIALSPNEP